MKDKLLILRGGKTLDKIKQLLLKLFCADPEISDVIDKYDENLLLCCDSDQEKQMKTLGYKTVTFAYTDKKISEQIGNTDLEKGGYKFEDGV